MKKEKNKEGLSGSIIINREEQLKKIEQFNLFSDVFMSVALDDVSACQHVLRIVMGMDDLIVKEVRTQYKIAKTASRDAILDVLVEDCSGRIFNIEIQRWDTVNHARRTRFYGAMIDSEFLLKGYNYNQLPEVYVIYISENDLWKTGEVIEPIHLYMGKQTQLYEDGRHVIYVNAEIDDGSPVAELMKYFQTADADDMSQGALSERVHFLKREDGGRETMCKVMEEFMEPYVEKAHRQGVEQGVKENKVKTAWNLFNLGTSLETIAQAVEESSSVIEQWLTTPAN